MATILAQKAGGDSAIAKSDDRPAVAKMQQAE